MQKPWFEVQHYIDGKFTSSGDRFEVFYPATNDVIGTATLEDRAGVGVREQLRF